MEIGRSRKCRDLADSVDLISFGGAQEHRKSYKMARNASFEEIGGEKILKMAFQRRSQRTKKNRRFVLGDSRDIKFPLIYSITTLAITGRWSEM